MINLKEVINFLESLHIEKNENIICAVSGGPDSMCLLDLLIKNKQKYNYNIICAHINHNVRIESNEECIFVENYCTANDIIFEYMKIEKYDNENFHKCARNIRYEFFEKLIKKYNSKYLFTAHHGDDLMETVLMRIIRGSTLKGYGGFSRISNKDNYQIIRPLITLTKKEIEEYDIKNNINYRVDKSNFKDVYTRNRYRKYILPKLKDENKSAHLKFYNFSEYIIEAGNYFEKLSENICKQIYVNNKLDIEKFKNYEHIIQTYIIYNILKNVYKQDLDKINNKHVESIIRLVNAKNNGIISLPNKKGIKEYNYFYIDNIRQNNKIDSILKDRVILPNGRSIEIVKNSTEKNNNVIYLNSNMLELPLHVRNRKPGDKMKIKNMESYKKISDIFINEKISKQDRDNYPIVVDNKNEIIWLPGLKKSHFDSQKSGKYDIILKYY